MANTLTTADFDAATGTGVALIDFYSNTCPPCRAIAPVIDQISDEYEGKALVAKVNAMDEMDLAVRFGVRSVPTIVILKDGVEVNRMVGAHPKPAFTKAIDEALDGPQLEW